MSQGYSSVGRAAVSKTACRGFKSFCPCQNKKTPAGVFLFWLGLNNLNTRHAERVEGCGSPVETSARSAEAPTEPAGETKSFCPCQKETVTILVTVSFLLDKTCLRHARAGLRRRALPVADAARRGWRSGQNLLPLQGGINFGNRLITLE